MDATESSKLFSKNVIEVEDGMAALTQKSRASMPSVPSATGEER